jgi:C-terminal processing protease CtpA/Prc
MGKYSSLNQRCRRGIILSFCVLLALTSCRLLPPNPAPTNQTSGMSDRKLDNLIAFTRLLGYVQYFHPSDQASSANWEQFAEQGLVAVESAVDGADLAGKLNNLFQSVAPTVRVYETGQTQPPLPDGLQPAMDTKSLQVIAWRHHGFGGGDTGRDFYYSDRIRKPVTNGIIPSDMADPREPFYANLGGGVSALIPLALFADDGGTLPHQVVAIGSTHATTMPATIEKTRHLATVALAWNVFQHFYPYFDVVKTDWLSALGEALIGANSAKNEDQFVDVLRKMVAQLHDGHGTVMYASGMDSYPIRNPYRPPIGWDWVENHLVITFVENGTKGNLHPGDRVTGIDSKSVDTAIQGQEQLISGATPQWIRFNALRNLLEGPLGSKLTLTIKPSSGPVYQITLNRTEYSEFYLTEPRPSPVSELQPGIWYVDLTRINDGGFNDELRNLTKAVGIIFDMRGYPQNISLDPISHLIDRTVPWPQLMIPVITYPDHQKISYDPVIQSVEPVAPHITAKIAFITDGRAISYAESYMGIIEANKIADIVGGPTAGTNGNVAAFTLFGRYTFRFTGMVVRKLDGSPHHGVGVQPTVPVSRTLVGVRAGRDELLEKAIMVVKQK